jgi:hypothetical protein
MESKAAGLPGNAVAKDGDGVPHLLQPEGGDEEHWRLNERARKVCRSQS